MKWGNDGRTEIQVFFWILIGVIALIATAVYYYP